MRFDARDYLTVAEAADYLSVSPVTVRRLIARGDLPAFKVGSSRAVRIPRVELIKLLRPIRAGY